MLVSSPQDSLTTTLDGDAPRLVYEVRSVRLVKGSGTVYDKPNFFGHKNVIGVKNTFEEEWDTTTITIDLPTATLHHSNGFETSVFDRGAFELMNFHQWSGQPPYTLIYMLKGARPHMGSTHKIGEEPPLWEIATVDTATGERRVFLGSHCSKDHIFTVQNRINALVEYARAMCHPWRGVLDDGAAIPLPELQDQLRENPPRFRFTALPTSGENGAPFYF